MAEKKINYSENEKLIVATLEANPEGLTIAELNEVAGADTKAGSYTSLVKKGNIAVIGERAIETFRKKTLSVYEFVTAEPQMKEEGKAHNYTEKEAEVLAAAANLDGEFLLQDLADEMGLEKLAAGRIVGLIKKGNIAKVGEREFQVAVPGTHKVYGFVAPIAE